MLIEDVSIRDHPSAGEILQGEWVYVNRAHMKKYVILYCHGGGYTSGALGYARILSSKLSHVTGYPVLSLPIPSGSRASLSCRH